METETLISPPVVSTVTEMSREGADGACTDSDLEGSVSDDLVIDMETNVSTGDAGSKPHRSGSDCNDPPTDEDDSTSKPPEKIYLAKCETDSGSGGEVRVPEPRIIFELLAKEHRKRRLRTVFSDTQINTLEQAFRFSPYINTEVRVKLSEITGLSDNAIQIWFQNRRARQRKTGDPNTTLDSPPQQNNEPCAEPPLQPPVILVPVKLGTVAKQPPNSQPEHASSAMSPANQTQADSAKVKVPASSSDESNVLKTEASSVSVEESPESTQTGGEEPVTVTATSEELKPLEQNRDPDIEMCPLCPEKFTCRRLFAGHLEQAHHCLMAIADCLCHQCSENTDPQPPQQDAKQRLSENSPSQHSDADVIGRGDPDYTPPAPCPTSTGVKRKKRRNSRKSAKTSKRSVAVKQRLKQSKHTDDVIGSDDVIDRAMTSLVGDSEPSHGGGGDDNASYEDIRHDVITAASHHVDTSEVVFPSTLTASNSSTPKSAAAGVGCILGTPTSEQAALLARGSPALVLPNNTSQSGYVLLPVSFNNGSMTCLAPGGLPGGGQVTIPLSMPTMTSSAVPSQQKIGERWVSQEGTIGGGLTRRSSRSSQSVEDRGRNSSPLPTRSDSPSSDDSPHFSDLSQFLNGVNLHPLKPIPSPTPPKVDEKKHMCEICGGLFAMPSGLKRHMLNHTDTRNYQCKICNKRFKLSHHLDNHLKMHLGLKEACPQCPAKFTQSYALKQHVMRVHHCSRQAKKLREVRVNVEKHQCHICNTVLANSTELSTHVSQHVNRKHICDLCGKDFAVGYQLAKHRRQHEKRPFMCIACGDLFGTMESLTFHQGFCTDIMERDLKNGEVESGK